MEFVLALIFKALFKELARISAIIAMGTLNPIMILTITAMSVGFLFLHIRGLCKAAEFIIRFMMQEEFRRKQIEKIKNFVHRYIYKVA